MTTAAAKLLVILFYGLAGYLGSAGIDETAQKLRAAGIDAQVLMWTDWQRACEMIEAAPEARILLVGHSLGGGAAIDTAGCAQAKGRVIDELVAIDGRQPWSFMWIEMKPIPSNVLLAVGYQRRDNPARGKVRAEQRNLVTIIQNIKTTNASHIGIATTLSVQAAIVSDARRLARQ